MNSVPTQALLLKSTGSRDYHAATPLRMLPCDAECAAAAKDQAKAAAASKAGEAAESGPEDGGTAAAAAGSAAAAAAAATKPVDKRSAREAREEERRRQRQLQESKVSARARQQHCWCGREHASASSALQELMLAAAHAVACSAWHASRLQGALRSHPCWDLLPMPPLRTTCCS